MHDPEFHEPPARGDTRWSRRAIWPGVGLVFFALFAGLLRPAIEAARETGRVTQCQNNLRQLGLAVLAYAQGNDHFPNDSAAALRLPPEQRIGFVTRIFPYLDHQGIAVRFEEALPWDDPKNVLPVCLFSVVGYSSEIERSPEPIRGGGPFRCPSNPDRLPPAFPGVLHYVGIAGVGTDSPDLPTGHPRAGVFGYERRTRLDDLTDGASTTVMLTETTERNGPWTAGGPSSIRGLDQARQPYIGTGRQFGGSHPGGVNMVFADGAVRFLNDSIDPKVFEALATVAGGEKVPAGAID